MTLGFIVGDTVDVTQAGTVIQGEVTRIDMDGEDAKLIEIQRPSGSHNEYVPDDNAEPGEEFAFIEKVT